MRRFAEVTGHAMDDAIAELNSRAQAYAELLGTPQSGQVAPGEVITVEEVRARISRVGGDAALARVAELEAGMLDCDDPLRLTRTIINDMVNEAGITGPAVVVGLSSLVYPSTHLGRLADHKKFSEAIEAARLAYEADGGSPVKYREYFTGISDMSFFGHRPEQADASLIATSTPVQALVDQVGPGVMSFPVVNIGPWGREAHQRLERVYTPYAFGELPRLLKELVLRVLV
jgi:arginine utilization protein RocB